MIGFLLGVAIVTNNPITQVSKPLTWAEQQLIQRESGGNPLAASPYSSAFGLGQLLWANRVRYAPGCNTTPITQIKADQLCMMRAYIAESYGTAENAWAVWQRKGWY